MSAMATAQALSMALRKHRIAQDFQDIRVGKVGSITPIRPLRQ